MKLLNQSIFILSFAFLAIIGIWTIIFYFNLKSEIRDSIDDGLDNNRMLILQKMMLDSALLYQKEFGGNNFKVHPISKQQAFSYTDVYKDTMMYRLNEDDLEPVRVLHSAFEHQDSFYRLTVISSLVEEDDLIESSFWGVVWLFIILITSIMIVNNLVLRKVWNPFYEILERLKNYRLDRDEIPANIETNTKEFKQLQEASNTLFRHSKEAYLSQKQFTENASHELQTPIAIITNKLELLLESENLAENDATTIAEVIKMTSRLKKLNQSLLLLVKIENKQFLEEDLISINQVIKRILENYQELIKFQNIELELVEQGELTFQMNEMLAEMLISNLFRNALFHNHKSGLIKVKITKQDFIILNSGMDSALDSNTIFNRFEKDQSKSKSTGLGLAICKAICKSSGIEIEYQFKEKEHNFSLIFKKNSAPL
jgi:signal transduction histidine kinase